MRLGEVNGNEPKKENPSFEGLRYEASRESVICVVIRIRRATRTKELVAIFNDENLVDDGINELKSLIDMGKDIYGDVKYLHLDSGRVYLQRFYTRLSVDLHRRKFYKPLLR